MASSYLKKQYLPENIRILIVDDDEHVQKIASAILSHSGYKNVKVESNPYTALQKLQKGRVDLVILDWKMPQLSGLDIVKNLRGCGTDIPILMLTGINEKESVVSALKAGVSDYLVKPFSGKILSKKIQQIIENYLQDEE